MQLANELKLHLQPVSAGQSKVLFSASTTPMPIVGVADIKLKFSDLNIYHTVQVVDNISHNLILGSDFMRQNAVVINYQSGLVTIGDDLAAVPLQSYEEDKFIVNNLEEACVPGYCEMLIPISAPRDFDNKTVIIEPIPDFQFKVFAVARSINKCENGRTICKILNFSSNNLVLKRGTEIAKVTKPQDIVSCVEYKPPTQTDEFRSSSEEPKQSAEDLDQFMKDYGFKVNPELTAKQRYELLQLLSQSAP